MTGVGPKTLWGVTQIFLTYQGGSVKKFQSVFFGGGGGG